LPGEADESNGQLGLFSGTAYFVRISFPRSLARARVLDVARKHVEWIRTEMQRQVQQAPGLRSQPLVNGAEILYQGEKLQLQLLPGKRPSAFDIQPPMLICRGGDVSQAKLRVGLERWFRRQAADLIQARISSLAEKITRKPFRFAVRGQKTRWGSCSSRGLLSFNWKLAMTPAFVLDYILIHELAHLEEFNHSERFWQLVRSQGADVKKSKAWLKMHRAELE
jgi:predicted metal-dependent hydrolase